MIRFDRRVFLALLAAEVSALALAGAPDKAAGPASLDVMYYFLPG